MSEDTKKARPDGGASGRVAGYYEQAAQQSPKKYNTYKCDKASVCIFDILPTGAGHAISRRELSALTGLPDRQLRRKIAEERRSGRLILSSSESNGGYYKAANVEELRRYVRSMQSRSKEILSAIYAAQAAIETEREIGG